MQQIMKSSEDRGANVWRRERELAGPSGKEADLERAMTKVVGTL